MPKAVAKDSKSRFKALFIFILFVNKNNRVSRLSAILGQKLNALSFALYCIFLGRLAQKYHLIPSSLRGYFFRLNDCLTVNNCFIKIFFTTDISGRWATNTADT